MGWLGTTDLSLSFWCPACNDGLYKHSLKTVIQSSSEWWAALNKCYVFKWRSRMWWLIHSWLLLAFCSTTNNITNNIFCLCVQNMNLVIQLTLDKLKIFKLLLNVLFQGIALNHRAEKRGAYTQVMIQSLLAGYSYQGPRFNSRLQLSQPACNPKVYPRHIGCSSAIA